jgi:hypothetical protein
VRRGYLGHEARERSLREGFGFVAVHASKNSWPYKELHGLEASDALVNMLAMANGYDDPRLDRVASALASLPPENINPLLFAHGWRQ